MKTFRAVAAGIIGSLMMSVVMWILRLNGVNVSLEAILGSLFPPALGLSSWWIGFIVHLAIGGVIAIVYAFAFEVAVQRSGLLLGAGFGFAHGMVAGLFMSGIPAMNPVAFGSVSAPGAFLSNIEYGPFLFMMLHCIYGMVVGVLYGRPLQKAHIYTKHPV